MTAVAAENVPNEKHQALTVDEAITLVGEYGRFQIVLNAIFCFMSFPPVYQIMIMSFAADTPNWKCAANSAKCNFSGTFDYKNRTRCTYLSPHDWEFDAPREYSMVTQFNISCHNEWILELNVSVFFIGWIIGSVILGWFSDNYGRKIVVFVSMAVILVTALISPFLPSIYAIIFCRLIIGTFIPGTFQQMIMLMTEIVGSKYRAFSGNIIFVFVTTGMAIAGLKAYFIREWKLLYIVCSAPYFVVFLFYRFVPESLRTLAVNGNTEELKKTLQRIAKFNNREFPSEFLVVTQASNSNNDLSISLDLFRPNKFAKQTLCQSLGYVVGGMTFYGLYLAAKDIGGSLYRDFTIVTMSEIPFALSAIPLCDRFGRKKTVMSFYLVATVACICLCFAPNNGKSNILRILLGMVGKSSVGAGYNTLQTWTMELYPTYIRGGAMGFLQVLTRLGAALAPFVDGELMKVSPTAAFIFFACVTFSAVCLLPSLKEMKGETMGEKETEKKLDVIEEVELKTKREFNGNLRTNYAENELYNKLHSAENSGNQLEDIDKNGVVNESYDDKDT